MRDRIALAGSYCYPVQNVQPARFLHRKVHIPNWTEVVPSADRACPYGTFEACHENLAEAPSLDSLDLDFCEPGGSGTCASGQSDLGPWLGGYADFACASEADHVPGPYPAYASASASVPALGLPGLASAPVVVDSGVSGPASFPASSVRMWALLSSPRQDIAFAGVRTVS